MITLIPAGSDATALMSFTTLKLNGLIVSGYTNEELDGEKVTLYYENGILMKKTENSEGETQISEVEAAEYPAFMSVRSMMVLLAPEEPATDESTTEGPGVDESITEEPTVEESSGEETTQEETKPSKNNNKGNKDKNNKDKNNKDKNKGNKKN